MHYLIDGYNWLFRTPKSSLSFEEKRRLFIEELYQLSCNLSDQITLVFDAKDASRDLSSKGHYKSLEIIYTTHKQNADEYILQALEEIKGTKTVITRDRELASKAKLLGAKVLSMDAFYEMLLKKKKKRRSLEAKFQRTIQESPVQMARLLALFEKRFLEDLSKDLD